MDLIDVFLHLDHYLNSWAESMGAWLYLVLFVVVFCETGLVITPFLPGDSLLFAVGALAAVPDSALSLPLLCGLLMAAAILGDAANYAIGFRVGPRVFTRETSRLLNRKHLLRAQSFYERYGARTIFLARFVPIVRTFAPFVAGIGKMTYPRFAVYNVTGAIAWVVGLSLVGYFFGHLPFVKANFQYVILAIIVISVLPVVVEYLRARRAARRAAEGTVSSR